ncbi:MAG: hypothetical protein ATN35_07985 [Epulopiscium sp. Nele67-Bin004]|nr:MAG: hypothetical protein ATN35_07985 [Epulopiscium sp. Nele67-Bin004]
MRLIPIEKLRVGSKLAVDILDERFTKLLPKGHILTEVNVARLKTTNIATVYITDEYCSSTEETYTSQAQNVLPKATKIKQAIYNTANGVNTSESIAMGLKTINEIVNDMDKQKYSLKIAYEPKKIAVDDFGEEIVYIAMMSSLFALKMGFTKQQAAVICLGTVLRDIAVISPRFKGTVSPYSKLHPIKGYEHMKQNYNFPEAVLQIILQHHELYDGKGYPYGLKGKEICDGARIVAIIETFYKLKTNSVNTSGKTLQQDVTRNLGYLDPDYIEQFLRHVTIFGTDSLVILTNGDVATVTYTPSDNPFRPQVKIIKSITYPKGTIINLHESKTLEIFKVIYYID